MGQKAGILPVITCLSGTFPKLEPVFKVFLSIFSVFFVSLW